MTPLQWKRLFARIVVWIVLLVAFSAIVLLGATTWRVYVREREASIEHHNEVQALAELKDRKVLLEEDLQQLGTERGIEEEVRKRFPVVRPGETEILLVVPKDSKSATSTEKQGFWSSFFSWWPW